MDKIGSIEIKGDVANAYECCAKIWAIPPWEAVDAALKNSDTTKIEVFTSQWADGHEPFSGPVVELVKRIRGRRMELLVRVVTDTSSRIIEIVRYNLYYEMQVDFGENGSIFAAGDLYARLMKLDEDDVSVKCWSPHGGQWQEDWIPKIGMSHSRLATDWAWGKLSEKELAEKLEEVA